MKPPKFNPETKVVVNPARIVGGSPFPFKKGERKIGVIKNRAHHNSCGLEYWTYNVELRDKDNEEIIEVEVYENGLV